jgi:hypothetical protein
MVYAVFGLYTLSCVVAGGTERGTNSIDWAQPSMFYLKTETESSLRNVMFMDKVQKHKYCISTFIYVPPNSWKFILPSDSAQFMLRKCRV